MTSASKAGRATETRTSAWAARWKTTSGWRRPISSTTAGSRMSTWWTLSSLLAVGPGLGQVGERAAREVVDDVDAVALGEQAVDQGRPDEPRPAGDQCPHQPSSGIRTPVSWAPSGTTHVVADDGAAVEHRAGARPGPGRR